MQEDGLALLGHKIPHLGVLEHRVGVSVESDQFIARLGGFLLHDIGDQAEEGIVEIHTGHSDTPLAPTAFIRAALAVVGIGLLLVSTRDERDE